MFVPRNEVIYEDGFIRDVRHLPKEAQDKLGNLIEILCADPFDPRLHTKPLGPPLQGVFSFRITRGWRVGFIFVANQIIKLLIVDRRDNIYKRLLKKI